MAKLITNEGKEIELEGFELTNEQKQIIAEAEKPKITGWERVEEGNSYFFICPAMQPYKSIGENIEENCGIEKDYYGTANYFSLPEKAQEVAFETELYRKLKRFADENNEREQMVLINMLGEWVISYSKKEGLHPEYISGIHDFGMVFFNSKEIAEKALETFRPELEKYYGINQK